MSPRITLLRAALPVQCPSCGAIISWRTAAAHVQFLCPECHQGIHLRDSYFRVPYILSALVIGLLAYALGARGDVLGAVVLGVIPINFVIVFLTMRIFPPD